MTQMTAQNNGLVRVTRRFDASAERVYDAFLDPSRASAFLFATPTGRIVRCEIDARVGGGFTIVDRRDGEDVAHAGTYLALERPRRLVFTLSVPKYSNREDTVTIDIAPLARGCELTLAHERASKGSGTGELAQEGWAAILAVAVELLVDDAPTCGIGLAQHSTIPATIAAMFDGLADTLDLHRRMLVLDDPNARQEDEVYRDLAERWKQIARLTAQAAEQMAAQRELPMGLHDETAWGEAHVRAFERFVKGEMQVLALLRVAAERDEKMLASIEKAPDRDAAGTR
jgi:uncharacterized protein YndB with AHSA1/START domain